MKYTEECDCCGNQITAYTHHLNIPLVKALKQLVEFYEAYRKPATLQKDLKLDINQNNNFQKLQYFGLVTRTADGWFPTTLGTAFIYGEKPCMLVVATFGKHILDYTHPAWQTVSNPPQKVFVYDIDKYSYKQRTAYQAEKSKQQGLF